MATVAIVEQIQGKQLQSARRGGRRLKTYEATELADAFHDNNMRQIVGMLASAQGKTAKQSEEYYHTPRYTFDEYLESYEVVIAELYRLYFVVNEIEVIYNPDKVRVVFFYA